MPKRSTKRSTRQRRHRGGAGMLSALTPVTHQPALPGGLSSVLPNDSLGRWESHQEATQWGPNTSAPAPLANGGLYTNPQSTASWASSPFPATQHALALESAAVSGIPEVAYHQRPNDNFGASFSPRIATPITPQHWSASGPIGPVLQQSGGNRGSSRSRRSSRNSRKSRNSRSSRNSRKNRSNSR
jgi:hypothetical protein